MGAFFTVTVTRSYTVDVTVDEEAVSYANRHNFPLPAVEEWQGMKDWAYAVYDDGELVYEEER